MAVEFRLDDNRQIPSRSSVGHLAPDIEGEGQKVILGDGSTVNWSPPPVHPVIPDVSNIKSIRHYFNRTDFRAYPMWLYHPKNPPVLVKNSEEAESLGVIFRQSTDDERMRGMKPRVWEFIDDSPWRPVPYPENRGKRSEEAGKTLIASNQTAATSNAMIADLVPAVAAAVAKSLQSSGPSAPASIDPKDWDEFLQFQAWKKASAAVEDTSYDEREVLVTEAERKGIRVDGRWSLERLRAEVLKAD